VIQVTTVAIGIGLAVSLLFSEVFGLAAGGMVVPGYFALFLNKPVAIALTVAAALSTYFIVHLLSTFIIIYGKRRTVMMILVGFLVRTLFDRLPYLLAGVPLQFGDSFPVMLFGNEDLATVIGYVIPGLVAIWMDRQGAIETLATLLTASVVVRLILILIYGTELVRLTQ
jgi:poly-gamma-glutamate biosynthesis protein PgsC/CapC